MIWKKDPNQKCKKKKIKSNKIKFKKELELF